MPGHDLRVAIVADDLTGAMDSAVPFARRGLNVHVFTSPEVVEQGLLTTLPQVVSVNCNSRHQDPDLASEIVDGVMSSLLPFNPDLVVKKIDSTLRGNVVAETAAVMKRAGNREVLFCPAVPSQGRTFRNGELFVNNSPLAQTVFADDLRSPSPSVSLLELFQKFVPEIPVRLDRIATLSSMHNTGTVPTIHLIDAETDSQLLEIARASLPHRSRTLFVCASGLTEAIAKILLGPVCPPEVPDTSSGIDLFVVGSRTPQAHAQIETLQANSSNTRTIDLMGAEPLADRQLKNIIFDSEHCQQIILRAPPYSENKSLDSDLVARSLAESAALILASAPVRFLFATGGDTARAIVQALKVPAIRVCGEVQPGVVHGMISYNEVSLPLVTKAGGFGDSNLFCEVRDFFSKQPVVD